MPERPGVSIVIDSYNHAPYVAATIESALNQDYPRTEVIVVDDGSPDNSREIIAGFGDAIKTHFQANQGQVAACTAGFGLTQHEIVIFLDSDDLLVPHAVSTIVPYWTSEVAKIQFCLSVIDGDGRALGNVFPKYPEELTPDRVHAELLRTGSYPDAPTSGNAYTRRFLEAVLPLSEATRNGVDGLLNCAAPLYGKVVTVPKALAYYRMHDANDYALHEFSAEKFDDYIVHSERRVHCLRHICEKKGIHLPDNVLDHDVQHQEYCLVAARFPTAVVRRRRKVGQVALRALRAALRSPHEPWQRFLRCAWILLVALAPRRLAKRLVVERYVVDGRWQLTQRLLNLGRKMVGASRRWQGTPPVSPAGSGHLSERSS